MEGAHLSTARMATIVARMFTALTTRVPRREPVWVSPRVLKICGCRAPRNSMLWHTEIAIRQRVFDAWNSTSVAHC